MSVVEVKTQVSTRCWGHHCVLLQLLFHVLLHTHACLTTVGPVGVSERLTSETYCDVQRLPSAAVYHRSPGSAVISICFLMSSASLPSAIQRPDWIWRCISMLKRPGFICELLTDSGYHLCNCSMYWSQSQWVRGHTLPGSERLWRRGIYRRMWEEGLEFFFFFKVGVQKSGIKLTRGAGCISIWYSRDPMQRVWNILFEYVFEDLLTVCDIYQRRNRGSPFRTAVELWSTRIM